MELEGVMSDTSTSNNGRTNTLYRFNNGIGWFYTIILWNDNYDKFSFLKVTTTKWLFLFPNDFIVNYNYGMIEWIKIDESTPCVFETVCSIFFVFVSLFTLDIYSDLNKGSIYLLLKIYSLP